MIVINAFSMIQVTRLTKQVDFKTQMKVSLPSTILAGILGVCLAYEGFGVWSLVYMAIFRSILDMLFLFYNTKWLPSLVFHLEKFKYHFSFGYKLTFSGLLDIVFNNAYNVIIGKYYQPAILGFYDRANNLKNLPVQTLSTIVSRVLPNGKDCKVIFCTSTIKGEGKTFISLNLSLAMASLNKKVLLIGADLRNPQLHSYAKIAGW